VIILLGNPQGNAIERSLSQFRFHFQHGARLPRRGFGGIARQLKHFLHVLLEPLAGLARFRIRFQVILTIRQRKATLSKRSDRPVGISCVGAIPKYEERAHAHLVEARGLEGHAMECVDRADAT
jgi:hypothetical protein